MSSSNNVSSNNLGAGVNQVGDRTFITGQGIGFDTSSLVNAAVQQRERPAVRLDERIQENLARVEAFNQLDTFGEALGSTLSDLVRTDDLLGLDFNVFDQNAISARSNTSVAPTDLIDALVGNSAEAGVYELTVNQLAQAARVQSGEVADPDAALGLNGEFRLGAEGSTNANLQVFTAFSLNDIAQLINDNTATSGVSAEVLQTSPGGFRLIISAEETNRAINALDFSGDAILAEIGVFTYPEGPRDFSNFTLDPTVNTGFAALDGTNDAIRVIDNDGASNSAARASFAVNPADESNTAFIQVQKTPGGDTHFPVLSLQYADGTRGDVVIDTNNGTATGRFSAGEVELIDRGSWWEVQVDVPNVNNAASASLTLFYATANATTGTFEAAGTGAFTVYNAGIAPSTQPIGLNVVQEAQPAEIVLDGITFTRDSNEFADVIEDVDIDLRSADPNTTITLEVGNDIDAVRNAVDSFVTQYNELRTFLNQQQEVGVDGAVSDTSVLNGDTTTVFLQNQLSALLSTQFNTTGDLQTLRDIGITLDENNLLVVSDATVFEDHLTNNFDQLRALFETSFEADNEQIRLLGQTGATQRLSFVLDITTDGAGNVTGATANGNPVFDVSPTGRLTGVEGSIYEGVTLAYVGGVDATINVTIDQGLADQLSNTLNAYTDDVDGQIQTSIVDLIEENDANATRADRIREQAATVRDNLIERFAQLEAQVRAAEILQRQISALLGNNDDD